MVCCGSNDGCESGEVSKPTRPFDDVTDDDDEDDGEIRDDDSVGDVDDNRGVPLVDVDDDRIPLPLADDTPRNIVSVTCNESVRLY